MVKKDAIVKISEGRLGTVLVTDELGRLLALMSDGDIRRALMNQDFSLDESVLKYATKNPKTVEKDALAKEALTVLKQNNIGPLIVTENGHYFGIIDLHRLLDEGIN